MPHVDTSDFYEELKQTYSWNAVAKKTVKVYDSVMQMPTPNILSRIKNSLATGSLVFILTYFYLIIEYIMLFVLEFLYPAEEIDVLPDFECDRYNNEGILNYGNHSFNVYDKKHPDLNLVCATSKKSVLNFFMIKGQHEHMQPIRQLIGEREKYFRSERGNRTMRYETIRPDRVPKASSHKKNRLLRRYTCKDTVAYPFKKDIFAPNEDEIEEQLGSEQEFSFFQNQAKYLDKMQYNPFQLYG